MKITRVTALAVKIPQEDYFGGEGAGIDRGAAGLYFVQRGWRGLYSSNTESMLVKIETDEGLTGIGEGQCPVSPEVAATVVARILRPLLIGESPEKSDMLWNRMYQAMNNRGHYTGFMLHAIAAVDLALWDLRGKILDRPVASLLGGAYRNQIPAYVSGVRGDTLEDKAATALSFVQKGFAAFKTNVGFGLEKDYELVRTLSEAVGDKCRLMVDVLWKYDVPDAIRLGRFLQEQGCFWIEAPTSPEDVAGHAEIARALDMAVAAGETETTRYQFLRWLSERALDIAQPDVARCGITETRKIADLAEAFHVPVALHSGILLGPGIAATSHVASSIPNLIYQEYQPVMLEMANRMLKRPIRCEGGCFSLPEGPGLGVEVDEEALAAYVTGTY
jgi:galactonate dehydratase